MENVKNIDNIKMLNEKILFLEKERKGLKMI